jgi:hypothetical protein
MDPNRSENEPTQLNSSALASADPVALLASLDLSARSRRLSSLPTGSLILCLEALEGDGFRGAIRRMIEYLPASTTPDAIFAALFQSAATQTTVPSDQQDPADNPNLRVARNSPEAAVLERRIRSIYSAWFGRGEYLEACVSDPSRARVFQIGAAVFGDGYWPCDDSDNCAFQAYLATCTEDGTAPRHVRSLLRFMDATGYFDLRGKSRTWQVFVYCKLSDIVQSLADLLESESESEFVSASGDLVAFIRALMESEQFAGVAAPVTYALAV